MSGKRISYEVSDGVVSLGFEQGSGRIAVWTDEIIQVVRPLEGETFHSKAVERERRPMKQVTGTPAAGEFAVTEEGGALIIRTASLTAKVYDGFYVDFYRTAGAGAEGGEVLLCADYRGEREIVNKISPWIKAMLEAEGHDISGLLKKNYPVQAVKALDGDEKFYGLGDKTGFLNKSGYEYENWNSDIPDAHTDAFKALYKSVPFLITLKERGVYGLFFDNTYRSHINLGKEKSDYFYYGAEDGSLNYYFIGGEHMADVITNYTELTGRTPLPQLWTLGYHQSRWGYENKEDIRELMEKFRGLDIPCDTIHFDIDYMDGYRVFTWNEKDYGDAKELFGEMDAKGFKKVSIIDPGVKLDPGYAMYDEGIEHGYFAETPEGETYVNAVWPGDAVYPDFGNKEVRDWWGKKQSYLTDLGFDGVWNDMNEPASFHGELPKDVVFTDEDHPSTHAAMHNCYGHLMSKATYEGLVRAAGKRPFVITRACYAGTQKYSTVWTGDNQSLWAHIQMAVPQLCNLGLSGFAFAGTDVGGFGADTTPELLCRWVQVGAFSPLFRNHAAKGSRNQEPWQFDEQTLAVNRKFIELRYRLLPYFYDLFYEGEKTGLPVMRPLVMHYENDPAVWNLNDEFLVGEHLLVAPVVEQGATVKKVYLPEGAWYDFFTGKKYEGGQYYLVDAPIDVCPVFAKAGSVIPTYEVMQYVGEKPYDTLKLLVFPGEGRYVHYQDNGTDFAYRDGAYNLYEFVNDGAGHVATKLLHEGYAQYQKIETIVVK